MNNHIKNLIELRRLFCMDCKARKQGQAKCLSKWDNFEDCDYIKSLNFAIELIERINKNNKNI